MVCVFLVIKLKVSQSLLIALYELNPTEMSAMLSVLPKNFQVCCVTLMFMCSSVEDSVSHSKTLNH